MQTKASSQDYNYNYIVIVIVFWSALVKITSVTGLALKKIQ